MTKFTKIENLFFGILIGLSFSAIISILVNIFIK